MFKRRVRTPRERENVKRRRLAENQRRRRATRRIGVKKVRVAPINLRSERGERRKKENAERRRVKFI